MIVRLKDTNGPIETTLTADGATNVVRVESHGVTVSKRFAPTEDAASRLYCRTVLAIATTDGKRTLREVLGAL